MNEIEKLKVRLEDAKSVYLQQKREIETAESRVRATINRNLQPAKDALYILQNGLKKNITERKTSIVEMENYLHFVETIISNLNENGIRFDFLAPSDELNADEDRCPDCPDTDMACSQCRRNGGRD